MSKKNSSVNLKNGFNEFKDLSNLFLNFKKRLDNLNKKSYLVAVSGGPDSLALVALTKAYTYYRKKTKFSYAIIDHKIRKNSSREAIKVKNLLEKENIKLKILTNKKEITKNIQAEARTVRYKILLDHCKKHKINILLTAHNLEDQVETFLIRLSRGSGLRGLSAMKFLNKIDIKVSIYRPLLDIKKIYLTKISKKVFGKYINDPSNKDKKFLRTKVRNLKKPLEKSGIKYEQIFKSIHNLSLSRVTLEEYLNKILKNLIKKRNKVILINFKDYQKLNNDIKMAVINKSIKHLKKNYYDVRSKKVDNLIKKLNKQSFKNSTLGGCTFSKKDDKLLIKIENK